MAQSTMWEQVQSDPGFIELGISPEDEIHWQVLVEMLPSILEDRREEKVTTKSLLTAQVQVLKRFVMFDQLTAFITLLPAEEARIARASSRGGDTFRSFIQLQLAILTMLVEHDDLLDAVLRQQGIRPPLTMMPPAKLGNEARILAIRDELTIGMLLKIQPWIFINYPTISLL